jgi:hypothetical protein
MILAEGLMLSREVFTLRSKGVPVNTQATPMFILKYHFEKPLFYLKKP